MADLNEVTLSGRITRDPELRHTQSGTAVANTGIAVERYAGPDAEPDVSFFNLTIWSGFAELCANKLRKGDAVSLTGRLNQNSWEAEDGSKRSSVEVNVNQMVGEFIYRKADGSDTPDREDGGTGEAQASDAKAEVADDDDIPF